MTGKEKRHFKRYNHKQAFNFSCQGKDYNAETFDYSPTGVGVIIDENPPLSKDDFVVLNINPLFDNKPCVASWVKDNRPRISAGIQNFGTISISLKEYPLSDIFIGLQRSRLTGVLEMKSAEVHKKIYLKEGDMIFSMSNQKEDDLADILLSEGKIDQKQYNDAVELQKSKNERQGAILVKLGYLKPQELILAVRRQVEVIIKSLFQYREGRVEFKQGQLPTDEVITLNLSTANLIYRGIKTISDENYIRNVSPPDRSVLVFSPYPIDLFQNINLDEPDRRMLSHIDGKTTIKDMVKLSSLNELDALKAIHALLATRIIDIKHEGDEIVDIAPEEIIKEPDTEVSQDVIDRIEKIYEQYETLGYYSVLGVKDTATSEELKKAYYRMAKEFHPDRHYYLKGELKGKLNAIFSYVVNAYMTLNDTQKRKAYNESITVNAVRPNRATTNAEVAFDRFAEGLSELKRGKYEEALRLFGEASYKDGSKAKYHFYYGLTLSKLGKNKAAEKAMLKALESEPANSSYIAELGHIYLNIGLTIRAKGNFEKALNIQPTNERAIEGMERLKKESKK